MNRRLNIFVLFLSILWAGYVVFSFTTSGLTRDLLHIRLEETFALTALFFLYFSVVIEPIYFLFPKNSWSAGLKGLQKTLIVITFGFGLTHAFIAFFFLLGGFAGLGFLSSRFILGIILSATALICLMLVVSSFWQRLKRTFSHPIWFKLIYLVGILITIHGLLLGSQFLDITAMIPKILFTGLSILMLFFAASLDKYLSQKNFVPQFGLTFLLAAVLVSVGWAYYLNPASTLPNISIHAGMNMGTGTMPGMNMTGGSSKRYTVSFTATPASPKPGQDTVLKFKVYDAASGNEVKNFDVIYTKLLHLVIVDDTLQYFSHIHPTNSGSEFTITTEFPKDGVYHLYINFQPDGGMEQQMGFTLPVGNSSAHTPSGIVDTNLTKTFGNSEVTLSTANKADFNAEQMSDAAQVLVFDFKDKTTGQPITDLEPYLGAFGHLVLINEQTYDYIHVHPLASENTAAGGPQVKFLPAALYSKITPGIYRVFGQFQRNNQLFLADFTINVK